jgi:hypothetical protein
MRDRSVAVFPNASVTETTNVEDMPAVAVESIGLVT